MSVIDRLQTAPLEVFEEYNECYDRGDFRGSEATKYNLDTIKEWIAIRDEYTLTEDRSAGKWRCLDIMQTHSKYGINYIYINEELKLWRVLQTAEEFYNKRTVD